MCRAHEAWDLPTPPEIVTFSKKFQIGGFYYKDDSFQPKEVPKNVILHLSFAIIVTDLQKRESSRIVYMGIPQINTLQYLHSLQINQLLSDNYKLVALVRYN